MNKIKPPQNRANFDKKELSKALFIASQALLRIKVSIMLLSMEKKDAVNSTTFSFDKRIKSLRKKYNYLQSKRTKTLQHLIKNNNIIPSGYVVVNGLKYGHVSIGNYDFFVPISKAVISYFALNQIGDSFPDFEIYDASILSKNIMSVGKAIEYIDEYINNYII